MSRLRTWETMNKYVMTFAILAALIHSVKGDTLSPSLVVPMFSDHMVLQRDQADPIWGWVTPGEKIVVTMCGRTAKAVAESDGKWVAIGRHRRRATRRFPCG